MLLLISSWTPKDPSWTNQTPACQWANVTCTNGIVTQLRNSKKIMTKMFIIVFALTLLVYLTQPVMARTQPLLVLEPPPKDDLNKMLLLTGPWTPKDPSWTIKTPPCQWFGVNCTNGIVTGVVVGLPLSPRVLQREQPADRAAGWELR